MINFIYFSKKELKESVGKRLNYSPTGFLDQVNGVGREVITGAHRPHLVRLTRISPKTGKTITSKEFFATVTLQDGIIKSVK
jgi:hypothetical protein